jgi:hypothetical protein
VPPVMSKSTSQLEKMLELINGVGVPRDEAAALNPISAFLIRQCVS